MTPASEPTRPRVYLETTVLKFAVDRIEGWAPTQKALNWGGRKLLLTVHKPAVTFPNEGLTNDQLKAEASLLPRVAALARANRVELLVQEETLIEFWGLPRSASRNGLFYGAPVTRVPAPFKYGRVVAAAFADARKLQYEFLARLSHKRFIEIQKACGAYQGSKSPSTNQLRDAFHVWCAECANADFFLTCDLSLVRYVRRQKRYVPRVRLLTASELLAEIANDE
jgi:hypothetical protein